MARKKLISATFVILVSLLALVFALQGCTSSKLSIDNDAHPLYITTNKGITIIDTRTDKVIAEGFNPDSSDSIAAFYKTLLFTEYSGTDFPVNVSPATHIFDLRTGKKMKIASDQISFLKKERNFTYGLTGDYELMFIYDTSRRKFTKFKSSDNSTLPTFIGFISLNDRKRAIVLSGDTKSLDGQKSIPLERITASLIADNNKLIYLGGSNITVQDIQTNKIVKFNINLPGEPTAFYAYGKLYIGESTSAEDKPKLSTYKVYGLTDGKLIKTIKMDVRDYNTLKINDLLVFLTGPHKGYALNLKTLKIEKTNIAEQSVVQDGKIYSVVKDRLIVRRGKRILKTIKLDSQSQKKWDDDVSIYNRAIYSSEPTNDNFRIFEDL